MIQWSPAEICLDVGIDKAFSLGDLDYSNICGHMLDLVGITAPSSAVSILRGSAYDTATKAE